MSASPAGESYQWFINGIIVPGATVINYTPVTPGYYTCEVIYTGGCNNLSNEYPFKIVGLNEVELTLSVYPNPTNNFITVTFSDLELVDNIELTDARGRIIYKPNTINDDQLKIDLTDVSSGIYILKIESLSKSSMFRVVKN